MSTDYPTIAEAATRIADRQVSPVELTRHCLDRIAKLDGALHSFILVTEERAMADAKAAEAAIMVDGPKGKLHGIPIGLKDIVDTKGIPTTAHSSWLRDNIPDADAGCAERLAEAGSVLLGKLSTHEFADGGPSFDLPWPPARNPWNTAHFTAGSSSGTGAATAAGLILGGIGTDTGGSIRGPAALCGIAGIKPTYGLVSRRGVAPAAFSLDHIGPMAWTAEDCAIMLQALAGHDPLDPASADRPPADYLVGLHGGVRGLRIGVVHHFFEDDNKVTDTTAAAISDAIGVFKHLGAHIRDVSLPSLEDWTACGSLISITERAAAYEGWMQSDLSRFGERLRERLLTSLFVTGVDYLQATRRRRELCFELATAMADVDVLLTAAARGEAPLIDDVPKWDNFERPSFTMPFNVSGYPAISICAGFGTGGLPLAIQIAGKPFDEATVLRAAHSYETATNWRTSRPN